MGGLVSCYLKQFYGEINCTHNLHLLQHLPKYVKMWGPLWTHSTFCFENKNNLIQIYFTEQLISVSKCYSTSMLNPQFNILHKKSKFRMVNLWENLLVKMVTRSITCYELMNIYAIGNIKLLGLTRG